MKKIVAFVIFLHCIGSLFGTFRWSVVDRRYVGCDERGNDRENCR